MSSGRGLHAYVILDAPVTLAVWQPLADRLIATAQAAGLKFDVGVTRNPATLLRLPTTFNRKDRSTPLECRVLSAGSSITVAELGALLAHVPVRASALARDLARATLDPAVFPRRQPINGQDMAAVRADIEHARIVTSIELLRTACPVVADSDRRGGDGDREPLWFELAKLCHYVEGGQDYFHDLSSEDARYDPEQTDQKYEGAQPQGWPACATIAAASPDAKATCTSCPHYGQGRSPIHFARTGQVNGTVNGHAHPSAAGSDIFMPMVLPDGYQQDTDHRIYAADGSAVFNTPIYRYDIVSHPDGSGGFNDSCYVVAASGLQDVPFTIIDLPCSTFTSTQEMKVLSNKGLSWKDPIKTRTFNMDMITFIRNNRSAHKSARYGWVIEEGKIIGFSYGAVLHTADGPQPSLSKVADNYTPSGSLDEWKQSANLYVGKGLLEMEAVIATGFAAPLIQFTLVDGVTVFARSAGSGVGKTAAMETANSVWARRDMVRNDTTPNAIMDSLMQRKNLPVFRDEMVPTQYKYESLILAVSAGREKDRLDRNSNPKEARTACTMLVGAANASMAQGSSDNGDTNAQAVRVFEIELPDLLRQSAVPHDARLKARQSMAVNFGVAGMVYAGFLGRHHAMVGGMMRDVINDLIRQLELTEEDRFWVSAAAAIFVGATIAKKLDLIAFDTAGIYRLLVSLLRRQKTSMKDMNVSADDPDTQLDRVADFINEHVNAIIRTESKPAVGRSAPVRPLNFDELRHAREFVGRIAVNDKWMILSERKIKLCCKDKNWDYQLLKRVLLKAKLCSKPTNRRPLAAQCLLNNPPAAEYVLEFDLSLPANERFLPQ